MILLVLASSCKKDKIEESRPKTVADFEKIITKDLNFKSFISASLELEEDLTKSTYNPFTIIFTKRFTPRKTLNSQEISEMKSIKNIDELVIFLKSHKIEGAEERIAILKKQYNSFRAFITTYPEYRSLTLNEKHELLSAALKSQDPFAFQMPFSNAKTSGKSVMVADDDGSIQLYQFNMAMQGCKDTYRRTFDGIWIAADLAMLGTSLETAGIGTIIAFTSACIATEIAYNEMYACFNLASENFFIDLYN